jgi:hypothetical protein
VESCDNRDGRGDGEGRDEGWAITRYFDEVFFNLKSLRIFLENLVRLEAEVTQRSMIFDMQRARRDRQCSKLGGVQLGEYGRIASQTIRK